MRLPPADIADHPPIDVVCPNCGFVTPFLLLPLWNRLQSEMKPGASDSAIRRVMAGITINACGRCHQKFLWRLHAVRKYAIETTTLTPDPPTPPNISMGVDNLEL